MSSTAQEVFEDMCREEFEAGISRDQLLIEYDAQDEVNNFKEYCEIRFQEYKEQRREEWH